MKTIVTLDRANKPYGYPQLDGSGSLHVTGSLYGTASYALNGGSNIDTGSFATTGSNLFTDNQIIDAGSTDGFGSGIKYANQGYAHYTTGISGSTFVIADSSANYYSTWANADIKLQVGEIDSAFNTNLQIIGTETITGSNGVIILSPTIGSPNYSIQEIHGNNDSPWLARFYNDTFSKTNSVMSYFGWNDGRFVFHNDSTQSIGLQVNGYSAENGLLVYEDKVAFVNNVEITGSLFVSGGITGSLEGTSSWAVSASWAPSSTTNPGGSNKQVQFNDSGSFGGSSNFTFDKDFSNLQHGNANTATGYYSHAEGYETFATNNSAHSEGTQTIAEGDGSHAEGYQTTAHNNYSHAEGSRTYTAGRWSHAEGSGSVTIGDYSHAEGLGTITSGSGQHAMGKYNAQNNTTSIIVIGNGTDESNRSDLAQFNSDSIIFSSSLNVTSGITASLYGTSSWAQNALTASYVSQSVSSSYSISSSNSISASYAATTSYAPNYLPLTGGTINGNVTLNGTASITYLNVQYESASVIYSSGSNILGSIPSNTQIFYGKVIIPTGSLSVSGSTTITGSLNVTEGITGSLLGTSSYTTQALNSSYASTASYYGGSVTSASYALSSSQAQNANTASYVLNAVTASYVTTAQTASYVLQAVSSSYATTSSYAQSSTSASYALTASYVANASSFPFTGSAIITGSLIVTGSLTTNDGITAVTVNATSITASLLGTASYASQALTSSYSNTSTTASYVTGSIFTNSNSAASASYATYAATAGNGGVTQIIAGAGISVSPAGGQGNVTLTALGGSTYNTMTGSYGSFYDTGSYAIASTATIYSMSLGTTVITNGVYISGSDKTKMYFTNAGVYNLEFSAQFTNSNSQNQNVDIWIRQGNDGGGSTDLVDSNSIVTIPNKTGAINGAVIAAWNLFINAAANDYVQIMYAGSSTAITLATVGAQTGPTVPRTPALIATAQRVDTFLSNTGSFSGSFTGQLIGTASYASQALSSSYALTASYVLNAVSSSYSTTASYVTTAQTASYVLQAVSASYSTTASYVTGSIHNSTNPALSASYALTASYALNGGGGGASTATASFGITLDGQGGTISTGTKGYVSIPWSGSIKSWIVMANTGSAGSGVQVDLRRNTTSLVGTGNSASLASQQFASASVSGWTSTNINANDILEFYVNSATTLSRVTVQFTAIRTLP